MQSATPSDPIPGFAMARGWRSEYGLYVCLCGARYCRVGMGGRAGACVWCLWVFARAHAFGYVVCVRMCKCVCAEAAL